MSERITKVYKRFFEIHLLHHYWLDEGATFFDLISDSGKRDKRLLSYDMRSFLAINANCCYGKVTQRFGRCI